MSGAVAAPAPATILLYAVAALAEIAGCFSVFAVLRLDRSPLWLVPGSAALILFAYCLALAPSEAAGRTYAAYGGVYILASVLWMRLAEGVRPDRYDLTGAALCLLGAAIILFSPRAGA